MTDHDSQDDSPHAASALPKALDPARVLGREPRVVRKRFYKDASAAPAGDGFAIHLDDRGVRTPRKLELIVPSRPLATAIAAEWAAQGDEIRPTTMPLTSLACTAIDAVAEHMLEVAAEIGRYAASDLLCYRASAPHALAEQQSAAWDPILDWAAAELGVSFVRATGLMPVAQSPAASTAVVATLAPLAALPLTATHVLTTLTGSAILALAVLRDKLSLDDAWHHAHVDEDWQIAQWGSDAEAEARRAARYTTARAAARVLDMVK